VSGAPHARARPVVTVVTVLSWISQMKNASVLALLLAVAACSAAPQPEPAITGPADPDAPVPAASYQPVLSGTVPYGPVGLKPWRELNDSVAPGAGRSQ
jgi:hypothetical protein